MKRAMFILSTVLCTVLFSGCDDDDYFNPDPLNRTFTAYLTPEQEAVTPPVMSDASGQAQFMYSQDGRSVHFKINVANLEGVTMAHLHKGAFGVSGPVVVTLIPRQDPTGLVNGTLVEGTFTETDAGNTPGIETLAELRRAIDAGEIYVNVHTDDYPAGEIRGQLK